jgi:S-adenosylmethionine hydrolase
MRPIVALITDFGERDAYAGALRGAVLSACREATVVDVTHQVPRHDVSEASWTLLRAFRAFPAGAVFVVVVDPGVGSSRRALAAEAGGYRFVGPDNGVLGLVLGEHRDARVHEITNRGLFRHEVSATFHGRDIFGPVAGLLAQGSPLEEVGAAVADPMRDALPRPRDLGGGSWEAQVVHVDDFGNMTTGFTRGDLDAVLAPVGGDLTEVVAVVGEVVLPLVHTYAEISEGEPCALLGSGGRLEIAVNRGDASRALGAGRGARVVLRPAVAA